MRLLDKVKDWLLRPVFGEHPHAQELEAISNLLDEKPDIARLAHEDLVGKKRQDTGRNGMTGDQVVRVLLLKQIHRLSYRALEFHLQDSVAFRVFARAPRLKPWKWTTLQSNIKRLQPNTIQAINRILVTTAKDLGIETGEKVRTDCTAIESNIHKPTDSSLLWDGVRVLTRLLDRVREHVPSIEIHFTDHRKRARRRYFAIEFPPKGKRREPRLRENYQDLLKVSRKTCGYVRGALQQLKADEFKARDAAELVAAESLTIQLTDHLKTMERIIDQTVRRVIHGEQVPATEKVFSLFETHTDVIVKGDRDVVFGHKMCLTTGASSLIIDCFVDKGNPADSTLVRPVLERHVQIYGKSPRQVSFDGGFASKENLRTAKDEFKIQEVAFHKKCGLTIEAMTSTPKIFERLKRFRSGIEGIISGLKSAGMDRCSWRSKHSMESFRSYVWAHVLAFNVLVIARHLLS